MKKYLKIIAGLILLITLFIIGNSASSSNRSFADLSPTTIEATVVSVLDERYITNESTQKEQLYQKLQIELNDETKTIVSVENGSYPVAVVQRYAQGDQLIIEKLDTSDQETTYFIVDSVRRNGLLLLFILFILVTFVVSRFQAITSLYGMAFSFLVIFKFIIPSILTGNDPVLVSLLGSAFIVPVTFILSHGINKKTGVAILATVCSLTVTGILSAVFVELTKLTGFSSEESGFIQLYNPNIINMKGLLLSGIIIGTLGILDDITISQSAIVSQLSETLHKPTLRQLYLKAMNIGHDHIASVVNTLVLVYAGASLPLLLLFADNSRPFSEVINYEFIAEEVVRTLVASIGLVIAVPITTLIASITFAYSNTRNNGILKK